MRIPNKLLCFISLVVLAGSLFSAPAVGAANTTGPGTDAISRSFQAKDGRFLLDGKPFQIISGEMHYPRIPRAYWRARFRMAKAMGLNTISTYVFWNEHEPQPGVYDFTGQRDVAEFIREAQSEGLYVILRPGPYVCAEWEWGGYPAWLLKQHGIVVRSTDPKFMQPARRWLLRLGKELAPLQIGNGGPIIAVQVENEYGSFGDDHQYMEQIHRDLVDAGFTKALLYTADGPEQVPKGSLPELPAVVNFAPGNAKHAFETLHQLRPAGPIMAGEWWDGWFDHWGGPHHTTDAKAEADELSWILSQGDSINIYMFHGGTSFGWMNGANQDNAPYGPDVTSYDYDAALDESGRPTAKYFLFRDAIARATGNPAPPVPDVDPPIALPPVRFGESAPLWASLPKPVHSENVLTMEDLNQAYGYILYRTTVDGPVSGDLALDELHDYAPQTEPDACGSDRREDAPRHSCGEHGPGELHGRHPRRARGHYTASDASRKATERLGYLFPADEQSRRTAVPRGRLHRGLLLPWHAAGGAAGGHVPRHEQLHERIRVGERSSTGPNLEHRPAKNTLSARPMASRGCQ